MSSEYIDGFSSKKQKDQKGPININKLEKKCPECNGTGSKLVRIMMVDIPGITDNNGRGKPKKPLPIGACERCKGTGKLPLFEPRIL